MRWNTVIFDLDGTLLDSLPGIKKSVDFVTAKMGFPEQSAQKVKKCIGKGVEILIENVMPQKERGDEALFTDAVKTFREHYATCAMEGTLPYTGARELIDELSGRGIKMAVVSNKPDEIVGGVVKHFLGNGITYAFGERKGIQKKPAPDLVIKAMEILNSDKSSTVYVGDSEVDVQTARNFDELLKLILF